MNIRAAVLRDHSLRMPIECVAIGEPRNDEVLVRIVACGVCHTDLKVAHVKDLSPRPIVLGHEGAGVVERVGSSVSGLQQGDHVILTFDWCGHCTTCLNGKPSYCVHGPKMCFGGERPDGSITLGGSQAPVHGSFFGQSSFATHAIANERNAIRIDKDLPLEFMAPLACGLQTGAGAVLNTFKLGSGQSIAVFGVGAVGLAAVMAARIAGAGKIFAVDISAERLSLAAELGATRTINTASENALERIRSLTAGGVDFALDTTAVDSIIHQAIECTGPLGTCGLIANKGPTHQASLNILNAMLKGRTVRGIVQGDSLPSVFLPRLAEFYRKGQFPIERLVKFYAFEDIDLALAEAEAGMVIKAVLKMS